MPQMMPLNWLMLFIFFSTLLIMFNMVNYYTPLNKNSSKLTLKTFMKSLAWKW
uniref:ATP synthase complex subunit 8 n=1 Tax=Hestiasula sp. JZ-2017 TaxID=2073093 RepID=A0A343UMI2_9NEOP|nr:ATP synthase F0 subunit 8 [Hestiasula sp. JZ-2017]